MLRVSLLAESPGGTLELMAIITHIAIQLLTSHYEDVHTQKEQFEAFPSFLSLRFCNGAIVADPAVFPATGPRPVRLAAP